jgi:hypothetical protein
MANSRSQDVRIDRRHTYAICEEIGYRLGQSLECDLPPNPTHVQLLDRLEQRECASRGAPSIVPSADDVKAARGFFSGIFRTSTALRGRRF